MHNRIREARESKGLSNVDFATQMHVSTVTIWRWERGELNVDIETLQRMATILDTTPLALVPALATTPTSQMEDGPTQEPSHA